MQSIRVCRQKKAFRGSKEFNVVVKVWVLSLKGIRILDEVFLSPAGRKNRDQYMECPFTITEVFCGAGRVSDAFEADGDPAARFDVRINTAMNVHTLEGVMYLARRFAQTKPFESLGLLEPCCGSWVWVNLGSSLRMVVTWLSN